MNEATLAPDSLAAERDDAFRRLAWLSTVDHKKIGILYLLTALVFFVAGGVEAIFTLHGTTMIFLVAMPALFGLANYFVPLQIGARDMAFPRLNAFSFWVVPMGGILLHLSLLSGSAPS